MAIRGIAAAQSALMAQSKRLHASAHNTANLQTEGYKSLTVSVQEAGSPGSGVETTVERTDTPGPALLDDGGTIIGEGSNVDLVDEAVTRITAKRAYEANLKSLAAQSETTNLLFEIAD